MPNDFSSPAVSPETDTKRGSIDSFVSPSTPIRRLPDSWNIWEQSLSQAIRQSLKYGSSQGISDGERSESGNWRRSVVQLPVLSIEGLLDSVANMRRARLVLTMLLHFYVHTQPPSMDDVVHIPTSIAVLLHNISKAMGMPPVLTYSDNVLYNWSPVDLSSSTPSADDELECLTSFTSTPDESHFNLTSARIELRGNDALKVMKLLFPTQQSATFPDPTTISSALLQLSAIIQSMTSTLLDIRRGCDPTIFYTQIRPWLNGASPKPWVFDGVEGPDRQPTKMAGSTAGQSPTIQCLDAFLGVEYLTHTADGQIPNPTIKSENSVLTGMRSYMLPSHRTFIEEMIPRGQKLRSFIQCQSPSSGLVEAYNKAVTALKEFRDAHIRVVTLYIINPSRSAAQAESVGTGKAPEKVMGTGGTELLPFLKGVRDRTKEGLL